MCPCVHAKICGHNPRRPSLSQQCGAEERLPSFDCCRASLGAWLVRLRRFETTLSSFYKCAYTNILKFKSIGGVALCISNAHEQRTTCSLRRESCSYSLAYTATQSVLMEGLETGWISHDNKSIPIALFLRGLHILAETLLNPDHGNSISNWIAVHHPELPSHEPNCLGEGNLEHQPSPARARLLVLAYWLAQDWPKRWIALIQQTGISATACLPHMNRLPAWMHSEEFEQSRTREQARSHDEVVAAKRLLTHLRGWPANNAELTRFMNTGIAPPLKPRSQPISPEVRQYFSRLQQTTPSNTNSPQKQIDRINQSSVRELYSPAQADEHLNELLEDMDDTETSLPTFKRQQRNQRERS